MKGSLLTPDVEFITSCSKIAVVAILTNRRNGEASSEAPSEALWSVMRISAKLLDRNRRGHAEARKYTQGQMVERARNGDNDDGKGDDLRTS